MWWQGKDRMPAEYAGAEARWHALGHPTVFWSRETLLEAIAPVFQTGTLPPNVVRAIRYLFDPTSTARIGEVVDMARYIALYMFGGVYADLDYVPHKSPQPLVDETVQRGKHVAFGRTNNAFLISPLPMSPFWENHVFPRCIRAWELMRQERAKDPAAVLEDIFAPAFGYFFWILVVNEPFAHEIQVYSFETIYVEYGFHTGDGTWDPAIKLDHAIPYLQYLYDIPDRVIDTVGGDYARFRAENPLAVALVLVLLGAACAAWVSRSVAPAAGVLAAVAFLDATAAARFNGGHSSGLTALFVPFAVGHAVATAL